MKKIPAPIDEKNISSDWFYDGLGDTSPYSIGDSRGAHHKCAFYRRFHLWEARWMDGFNIVAFEQVTHKASKEDLEELFNYVKASNADTGDDSLVIEYDDVQLYTNGIFTMSFYFTI